MQAHNLERLPSPSQSAGSAEQENPLPVPTQKSADLQEECKPMHGQDEATVKSTPKRAEKLAQASNYDLPKELLNSLLPPLGTPQEYMAGQLQFDSTDQETQSFTPNDGNTPARMSDQVPNQANHSMELVNQNSDLLQIPSLNDIQSQNPRLLTPARGEMNLDNSFAALSGAAVGNATRTAVKDTEKRRNSFDE